MCPSIRRASAGATLWILLATAAAAQQVTPLQTPTPQTVAPQLPPAAQAPAQPPDGFQLNQLQQAFLNQVLDAWQLESGKITTFKCSFERWEFDVAFGPGQEIPLNKNLGELSYHRPDKGSFQITEIKAFQAKSAAPGQQSPSAPQGDWVKQQNAIGEYWVCDGKSVYEYRHEQKQLVERPIPPQLQGQSIVDGPLPFLFGAEAAKLKARYWLRVEEQPNKEEIWLTALPKFQAQAADFSKVEVILDRARLLPKAMQVRLPNGSRHVYMFDIKNASVNNKLAIIQALFDRPRVPFGYKRIVEQMPVAQAPQDEPQAR
jgi:TIGR03009 family protein